MGHKNIDFGSYVMDHIGTMNTTRSTGALVIALKASNNSGGY